MENPISTYTQLKCKDLIDEKTMPHILQALHKEKPSHTQWRLWWKEYQDKTAQRDAFVGALTMHTSLPSCQGIENGIDLWPPRYWKTPLFYAFLKEHSGRLPERIWHSMGGHEQGTLLKHIQTSVLDTYNVDISLGGIYSTSPSCVIGLYTGFNMEQGRNLIFWSGQIVNSTETTTWKMFLDQYPEVRLHTLLGAMNYTCRKLLFGNTALEKHAFLNAYAKDYPEDVLTLRLFKALDAPAHSTYFHPKVPAREVAYLDWDPSLQEAYTFRTAMYDRKENTDVKGLNDLHAWRCASTVNHAFKQPAESALFVEDTVMSP